MLFLLTERFTPMPVATSSTTQYGLTRFGAWPTHPQRRRGGGSVDLNDLTDKEVDRSASVRALTTRANAAGVSLVTIDTAGITTDDMVSAEHGASIGRMDEGIQQGDMYLAMGLLAEETGGKTIVGRNDLGLALKDTEADWTAYYSLGYESPDVKPGTPRAVKVTVNRPGAKVRSRRAVVERTPEEKIADTVLSQVHIPRTLNPLRASLFVGVPKKSGKMWLLPLEFTVPFEKLARAAGRTRQRCDRLHGRRGDADGRISAVTTEGSDRRARPTRRPHGQRSRTRRRSRSGRSAGALDGPHGRGPRLTSYVQPRLVGDKPGTLTRPAPAAQRPKRGCCAPSPSAPPRRGRAARRS